MGMIKENIDLFQLGEKLRREGVKGTPIRRYGEVRNECWNCGNYTEEVEPVGDKGYYNCQYCNAVMHK